jgi:hypothetical protein
LDFDHDQNSDFVPDRYCLEAVDICWQTGTFAGMHLHGDGYDCGYAGDWQSSWAGMMEMRKKRNALVEGGR